ncbi:LOW QUALITY PROTEIN: tripartite motif-containing protein 42 [Cariama cristata]
MDENGHPCSIWSCCLNCCYLTCHSRREERCLCWCFSFTSEQNCSCFPCPYEEDKLSQCRHCSCAEHANCWRCCCSCSNDPDCKCCCCRENSACQYYGSKYCRSSVDEPHHSRTPETVQSKDVMSRFRTRNNAFVITPERNVSSHAFCDKLPLCKQSFLQPFMLPCHDCSCKYITKSKTKVEVIGNFYIIICPVCSKTHCLPYTNKNQLRENYLTAKLAKKYMHRHGFLRWRFDHGERPDYCETYRERRVATKRCRTCGNSYYNECLHLNHSENGAQDHIFTKAHQEDHEQWCCLLYSNPNLSEYCLDDHERICGVCKNSVHNQHKSIPWAVACSRQVTSLFDTIAKFSKVRGVDNDLMEVILLKNNFKTYKDTKRKEIRNGFLKLHMVLHEQEKEMMELLENIELKEQKEISENIKYTSSQLSYMDGLILYFKEALKEESQAVFLQAHLVKEIENAVPFIFQPSPHLKEDPLRKHQLNFNEIFSVLQGLPPLSGIKQSESKAEKYPYSFKPEIMVPRHVSSSCKSKQATLFQSPSLNSLFDLAVLSTDTVRRPSSTPPHDPTQTNEVCVYQYTACETPRKQRKIQIVNFSSPEPIDNESVPVPETVVIYQTIVYSRSAKIDWTCPTEDVDFFEAEFYEVAGIGPDNFVQTKLAGQLSKMQQNLEIHNLDPNTEYLFKVHVVNASGRGEWSEICKMITSDEYRKNQRQVGEV